ncbi:MAG TPA: sugar phosphate isomerase/epimerase [Gemmatimonadaceae bacterium]|nr:sugar phosphate isomerase/epimerase [Gemmatimonadaceae bacterium]
MSRRSFLTALGTTVGAIAVVPRDAFAAARSIGSATQPLAVTFRLGVASYSLRNLPLDKAIEAVKALDTPYINLKSFHAPYELPAAQLTAIRKRVEAAGLQIVGGGTITFDVNTDDGVRRYFDYARSLGMPLIVGTCHPDMLPRVESFARSYDIRVAIHNHGPEDQHYPSPYEVLQRVKAMDSRMGLCVDIGHTVRTGADVVKAIADAGPRLLDMHAKDLRDLKDVNSQCIVGQGAIPIPAIFRQLQAMRYTGCVNLEYEIEPDDPLPGMAQSFAYMRKVIADVVTS